MSCGITAFGANKINPTSPPPRQGRWLCLDHLELTLLTEEKIDDVYSLDTVVVKRWVVVEREQKFRVIVPDGAERGEFACEGRFVSDGICNLEVAWNTILDCDEVNFSTVEYAHIDFPEAAMKFKVHDILKKMPEVFALGSNKSAAKASVGDIVFGGGFEVLPSSYVVAIHAVEKECLAEGVNVGVERGVRDGEPFVLEHPRDLVHRKQIADVVKEELDDPLERSGVAVAIAGHDV